MNSLHASISFRLSGYALATFGTMVSSRSMAWSKGHLGRSFPALSSSNTLAYWAYCRGSFCPIFSAAWARDVERVSLPTEGWFSPRICWLIALNFCCWQTAAVNWRLCYWQAPRYLRRYCCLTTSGSSCLGMGVPMRWTVPSVTVLVDLPAFSFNHSPLMALLRYEDWTLSFPSFICLRWSLILHLHLLLWLCSFQIFINTPYGKLLLYLHVLPFPISVYIEPSSPKEAFFAYLISLSHHLSMIFYDIPLVCVHCRTL